MLDHLVSDHSSWFIAVLGFMGAVLGGAFGYGGAWAAMKWRLRALEKADENIQAEFKEVWLELCKLRDRVGDPFTTSKCRDMQEMCRNSVCERIRSLESTMSENHKFMVDLFLKAFGRSNGLPNIQM